MSKLNYGYGTATWHLVGDGAYEGRGFWNCAHCHTPYAASRLPAVMRFTRDTRSSGGSAGPGSGARVAGAPPARPLGQPGAELGHVPPIARVQLQRQARGADLHARATLSRQPEQS